MQIIAYNRKKAPLSRPQRPPRPGPPCGQTLCRSCGMTAPTRSRPGRGSCARSFAAAAAFYRAAAPAALIQQRQSIAQNCGGRKPDKLREKQPCRRRTYGLNARKCKQQKYKVYKYYNFTNGGQRQHKNRKHPKNMENRAQAQQYQNLGALF